MDLKRTERIADKILDQFADLRVEASELMYVAMYLAIKTHGHLDMRDRVLEFCKQVEWEFERDSERNEHIG